MGLFDGFKLFGKKKDETDYSSLNLTPPSMGQARPPSQQMTSDFASQENIRAKIDLMMTQVDSMRIQNEAMGERVLQIERMVKQLLDMSRS